MNKYYESGVFLTKFLTKLISYCIFAGLLFACGGGGGGVTEPPTPPTLDTTPDAFVLTDQRGVSVNTVVDSESITITGINAPTTISIADGEYSINGGAFTASAGTVSSGDTVIVRLTSSESAGSQTEAVLDIGGVTDGFSVITETQIGLVKTSNTILSWTTDGFENCEITNDQNSDIITINSLDLTNGSMLHFLPNETVFTLSCVGDTALDILDSIESTNFTGVEPFPETVGYYGSASSTDNSWAAIVNLTSPITFTDRIDFNNQVDSYCSDLGYIGVVKTLGGDFSTNDTYHLQTSDGIISGAGPRNKITLIPGDLSFDNVYTNRRNTDSSSGNVGIATIGNNASSIIQGVSSPTTGANQMVLCQTNIRLANSEPIDRAVNFVEPGPITLVNGLDTTFTNPLVASSLGTGIRTYVSSDPAVATVTETTGVVTVIGLGTTTITGTKAASPLFREAQATYELNVRAPLPVAFTSFIKTSDLTLAWETTGAASCDITNDQNSDVVALAADALVNGAYLHNLPGGTIFTLSCIGETGNTDSIVTTAIVENNLFPETVGYYGSVSSTDYSWAAIVNLTSPITFTDRIDFNNQVDAYCSGLGYIGVVKTLRGDFSTNDTYHLQTSDGIISGAGPSNKITLIPGDLSFDNVYTNRRNNDLLTGDVGVATIGNNASSIDIGITSPTSGTNQMVLCQTNIRLANSEPIDRAVNFVEPGPITLVNGLDTTFTNPLVASSLGTGIRTYVSSDPAVATVNETTGVVTVIGLGTTTITGIKAASPLYREAQATYELNVRAPLPVAFTSFIKTSDLTLAWETTGAASCDITNDQNSDVVALAADALVNGAYLHNLPGGTIFTLSCIGETGNTDSIVTTAIVENNLFPETVGYYGSVSSTDYSWAAIVNLTSPITFTDRIDFNNQVDAYCSGLGYIGVVKTLRGDFSTNDNYYLQRNDGIISGAGPSRKITFIPGDLSFDNVYTNRRNADSNNGNVGIATIGNNASSIIQGAFSLTTGVNQMVLCQTNIRVGNNSPLEQTIRFVTEGPIVQVLGIDQSFSNTVNNGPGLGDISYSSSDTDVASVNSSTGLVNIVGLGTITITATKEADFVFAEAQDTYELTVRNPQALNIQSFEKTSDMTLAWQTSAAVSCDITNDQNTELFSVSMRDLDSGILVHQLPGETQFTLACTGELGGSNSVTASAMTANLFPETVGYYGSASSTDHSWAAIVNLTTPISFTDRIDFNNQADSYCANSGYVGAVKTRTGDFSTDDTYYLQNTDGIIAGRGPSAKVTRIFGGLSFNNVYTNRRNDNSTNGNVGIATIGNNASSINQGVPSPTTGANQMVLCQTRIPTSNTFSEDIVISFDDPGPVNAVFGVDATIINAIVGFRNAEIDYSSSDTNVATVNSAGQVTIQGVGTTTITAVRAPDFAFNEATATYVLNVTSP